MQYCNDSTERAGEGLARHMPVARNAGMGPEGALIPDAVEEEDRIAVVYDSRCAPPEITVTETAGRIQTVLADGVAVAIVACAGGPRLTAKDILLVERFVSGSH